MHSLAQLWPVATSSSQTNAWTKSLGQHRSRIFRILLFSLVPLRSLLVLGFYFGFIFWLVFFFFPPLRRRAVLCHLLHLLYCTGRCRLSGWCAREVRVWLSRWAKTSNKDSPGAWKAAEAVGQPDRWVPPRWGLQHRHSHPPGSHLRLEKAWEWDGKAGEKENHRLMAVETEVSGFRVR